MPFNMDNFKQGSWFILNDKNSKTRAAFENIAAIPVFYTKTYDSGATLAEDVDDTELLITVSDGTKFSIGDNVQWPSAHDVNLMETVHITEINSNTLTVLRSQYDQQNNRFVQPTDAYSGSTIYIVPNRETVVGGIVPIEYDKESFKTEYSENYPDLLHRHPAFFDNPEDTLDFIRDWFDIQFIYETEEWKQEFWAFFNRLTGL